MTVASKLDKTQVAGFYRQMLLIRQFEEQSSRLYLQSKIRGFFHAYTGQEAVAVGALSALRDDDYVFTGYRDHGHALARGMDPKVIMAELYGKATGSSGGKGGSMHLFDVSKNFMGGYAIVGGQMPLAVGMALSIKYTNKDQIVLCFFGDGAVNEGEFHESLNLASLWKLPVLFCLENNLYGMGTHVDRAHAVGRDLYLSGDAYGIPAAQIDGMDVLAVREATDAAVARVRSGEGPVFIEAMTFRYRGHSTVDIESYRTKDEVDQWRGKDAIDGLKQLALAENLMSEDEFAAIGQEVDAVVEEAVAFADESPDPPPEALYENVYA